MEQNKSEWSLMAVIPPREATAGGPGPADPETFGRDRGLAGPLSCSGGEVTAHSPRGFLIL